MHTFLSIPGSAQHNLLHSAFILSTIMSGSKELTYADVASHNAKKDLYLVIHDKVYNTTAFVDEHPYVPTCPAVFLPLFCCSVCYTLEA